MSNDFATPVLSHIADFAVEVGAPIVIGETPAGLRRIIPILGGTARGRIDGAIEPGGADFQVLRRDDATELEARYAIKTHDGALIYVVNRGLRHGPKDVMDALARGESVDPARIYFRAVPTFETGDARYSWLTTRLFVSTGVRRPRHVELRIYELG